LLLTARLAKNYCEITVIPCEVSSVKGIPAIPQAGGNSLFFDEGVEMSIYVNQNLALRAFYVDFFY
jgi:hypothetical protein